MGGAVGDRNEPRAAALDRYLRTGRFGRQVEWYTRVESTNDTAAQLAAGGAPEGTLVVADAQSRGRGRGGRHWESPPDRGLYLSLVLRPGSAPAAAAVQTLIAAVAVAATVRQRCGPAAVIRWPNDILIDQRKVAGILAEGRSRGQQVRDLVVGIGVNLNHDADDFPAALRGRATSLAAAGGGRQEPVRFLAWLLESWESWYDRCRQDGPARLQQAWRQYSPESHGARVRVHDGNRIRSGRSCGISPDGALLLEVAGGARVPIRFGDVRAGLESDP